MKDPLELDLPFTSKEVLIRLGGKYRAVGFPVGEPTTDVEAARRVFDRHSETAAEAFSDETVKILLQSSVWARDGFQQVLVGHKQAAALMVTSVSEEMAQHVHMPWPSFYIEIPPDLLQFEPDSGRSSVSRVHGVLATRIELQSGNPQVLLLAAVDNNFVSLPGRDLAYFARGAQGLHWDDEGTEKASTKNTRVTNLLLRLFVNVCMMMTSPDNYSKRKSSGWGKTKRQDPNPQTNQYLLRAPVVMDFRPAIHSYIQEGRSGRELSVQFLVSGHWRRQAHGPNRSERKTIWIEPFWKGPETGLIAVTPKVM